MRNLLSPLWPLVVSILPIAVMASIYYGNFVIIESLLTEHNIGMWARFGICLGVLWTTNLVYTLVVFFRKQELPALYGLVILLTYIPLLYLYYMYSGEIIPRDVPRWMMPEDISLYAGTFIMPTLAHALFVLIIAFTKNTEKRNPWIDFLIAVLCPMVWYLFLQVILPLWQHVDFVSFNEHVVIIMVISGTVLFLFFLGRGIYILSAKKRGIHQRYRWSWMVILSIAFPVAGLWVNSYFRTDGGLFGDFRSPVFYILAVINGIIISCPDPQDKGYRLALFAARSITFPFILYFFLVFLPYLPLSVIAIVAVGTGFLMLTPLVLMIIQTRMVAQDIAFLSGFYSRKVIYAVFLAGFLTLPLSVTWMYLQDKRHLQLALDYVYAPDYSFEGKRIDADALQSVLQTIKNNKGRRMEFERQTPFLSTYYNWLVLDNLSLSDDKILWMEKVFTDASYSPVQIVPTALAERNSPVSITNITSSSEFDPAQKAWKSKVELEVTNNGQWQEEYATSFTLPEGCWISDYHLWIGDEKVHGILSEKKAATWIYQQITSYRQDPGIVYYLEGNRIALRVFPVEAQQARRTGFEVIHKEPLTLTIDGRKLSMGSTTTEAQEIQRSGKALYVSPAAKRTLPVVKRKPVYHFILDCSEGSRNTASNYLARITTLAREKNIDLTTARFFLTNTYTAPVGLREDVQTALAEHDFTGGFFLERSLETIFVNAYLKPSLTYPVVVVVTDAMDEALLTRSFDDFRIAFPESDLFYELNARHQLVPHSLVHAAQDHRESAQEYPVVAWPDATQPKAFLRLDDKADVILDESPIAVPVDLKKHTWSVALALQGEWLAQTFRPDKTGNAWRDLVHSSFEAQLMTPVTSFISLENEAQRKVLLKKQEDILDGNAWLDAGEETRMSEPGMIVLVLAVGLYGLYRRRNSLSSKPSL